MEVIVLFVLLYISVNSGHGFPQMNNVFRNQTWDQASNDSTCSMIGLNLTGEIEENIANISSSIVWGKHQTAWIGAYAKRVWINFEGCFYGRFKSNDSWLTMTSQGDPAKTCLKHCDYSRFVLTEDKCICYNDVEDVTTTGCLAGKCSDTNYTYCGKGTAVDTNNITVHCMCDFIRESNPSDISNEGNCLAVTYKPAQQFMAISMNCSHTYRPICYDPKTEQAHFCGISNNWLQSLSECYDNNTQFAGRTTNVTEIYNGTYWVGAFAVTYKLWGRPRSSYNSCVAVTIDRTNNHLTTDILPCDTFLPVLCSRTSLSTLITTGTTILGTYPAVITYSQIATIVGSVVGTLVFIIIIVVVLLWRRRLFSKSPSTRSNKNSDDLEMRKPSRVDNIGADDSIPNDVYNHLGEIKTMQNVPGEDLYAHTGAEGETYGHLTSEGYEEDSEYDHTFNHTVSDTYGHLNSSYLHDDDNAYDHTCISTAGDTYGRLNRHNHQSDNENNYDYTGDMYSHLHDGTNRDVGDDVYDHTGGSGNVYGHINTSKPKGNSEYDHTWTYTPVSG